MPAQIGAHGTKSESGVTAGTRAATFSLKIEAQKQGVIKGDIPSTWKAAADQIEILNWSHSITSPRDVQSGLPTGKRMHAPIEFLGKLGKAAPLLFTIIVTNENMKKVTLSCWSQAKAGSGATVAIYYTMELENAFMSEFEQVTDESDGTLFYRFAMTYEKITFTWKDGGLVGNDTWQLTTA